MIEFYNNKIVVKYGSSSYSTIYNYMVRNEYDGELSVVKPIYRISDNFDLILPPGFRFLLNDINDEFYDYTTGEIYVSESDLSGILDGITLRFDQNFVVNKMLKVKRGIVQMATGSGKTECISAFLKRLYQVLGYYPTTIILEPTLFLVNSTMDRLSKYGIESFSYNEVRGTDFTNKVIVAHPMSMFNDTKNDEELLKNVKVFISDEGHHLQATTWNTLLDTMSNVEYSIAMSASVIDSELLPIKSFDTISSNALDVIGATGNVIVDIPPSYYIKLGILSTPVVFRITNPADEYVKRKYDWHSVRKYALESVNRSKMICDISSFLSFQGYKTLILVGTKNHAYKIADLIHNLGMSDKCAISFGSGVFWSYKDDKLERDYSDVMDKYNKGEINLLIATSHLYEGMDVPKLDVVILASVGKQPRKIIQGVGRSLRKSKKGKYAYVIDFTDHGNVVLNKQSIDRLDLYIKVIGVQINMIYNCDFGQFKNKFTELEKDGDS